MATRDDILAAAHEIVRTSGIEGLHARTVATRVGINHAAVHYYFPKRVDLLLGLWEEAAQRFEAERSACVEKSGHLRGELEMIERICAPDHGFIAVWSSLFVSSLIEPSLKQPLTEWWVAWTERYRSAVQTARKSEIDRKSPFRDRHLVLAEMIGLAMGAHLFGDDFNAGKRLATILKSLEP